MTNFPPGKKVGIVTVDGSRTYGYVMYCTEDEVLVRGTYSEQNEPGVHIRLQYIVSYIVYEGR